MGFLRISAKNRIKKANEKSPTFKNADDLHSNSFPALSGFSPNISDQFLNDIPYGNNNLSIALIAAPGTFDRTHGIRIVGIEFANHFSTETTLIRTHHSFLVHTCPPFLYSLFPLSLTIQSNPLLYIILPIFAQKHAQSGQLISNNHSIRKQSMLLQTAPTNELIALQVQAYPLFCICC